MLHPQGAAEYHGKRRAASVGPLLALLANPPITTSPYQDPTQPLLHHTTTSNLASG